MYSTRTGRPSLSERDRLPRLDTAPRRESRPDAASCSHRARRQQQDSVRRVRERGRPGLGSVRRHRKRITRDSPRADRRPRRQTDGCCGSPGNRRNVSATTPRSLDAAVVFGSKTSSSDPVHDGITSVPPSAMACCSAARGQPGRLRQGERPGTTCAPIGRSPTAPRASVAAGRLRRPRSPVDVHGNVTRASSTVTDSLNGCAR